MSDTGRCGECGRGIDSRLRLRATSCWLPSVWRSKVKSSKPANNCNGRKLTDSQMPNGPASIFFVAPDWISRCAMANGQVDRLFGTADPLANACFVSTCIIISHLYFTKLCGLLVNLPLKQSALNSISIANVSIMIMCVW